LVTESAFDAAKLRRLLRRRLDDAGVEVRLGVRVSRVRPGPAVELEDGVALAAGEVFSCVYAETNALLRASDLPLLPLKHEITELALIRVPAGLASVGITIV